MSFHKKISFIKSGLRMFGFLILMKDIVCGAFLLILAEVLGVFEEIYEK